MKKPKKISNISAPLYKKALARRRNKNKKTCGHGHRVTMANASPDHLRWNPPQYRCLPCLQAYRRGYYKKSRPEEVERKIATVAKATRRLIERIEVLRVAGMKGQKIRSAPPLAIIKKTLRRAPAFRKLAIA